MFLCGSVWWYCFCTRAFIRPHGVKNDYIFNIIITIPRLIIKFFQIIKSVWNNLINVSKWILWLVSPSTAAFRLRITLIWFDGSSFAICSVSVFFVTCCAQTSNAIKFWIGLPNETCCQVGLFNTWIFAHLTTLSLLRICSSTLANFQNIRANFHSFMSPTEYPGG